MIKILVILLVVYLMVRFIRGSQKRPLDRYQPQSRVSAVETTKCPRCGTFVAEGTAHECVS